MNALANISYAVIQAVTQHLPDFTYTVRGGEVRTRRPYEEDCEIISFTQCWGSTALGFGGIGGSAMTNAQTTIVISQRAAAVYFASQLAYVIENPNDQFAIDMTARDMHEVSGARQRYSRA